MATIWQFPGASPSTRTPEKVVQIESPSSEQLLRQISGATTQNLTLVMPSGAGVVAGDLASWRDVMSPDDLRAYRVSPLSAMEARAAHFPGPETIFGLQTGNEEAQRLGVQKLKDALRVYLQRPGNENAQVTLVSDVSFGGNLARELLDLERVNVVSSAQRYQLATSCFKEEDGPAGVTSYTNEFYTRCEAGGSLLRSHQGALGARAEKCSQVQDFFAQQSSGTTSLEEFIKARCQEWGRLPSSQSGGKVRFSKDVPGVATELVNKRLGRLLELGRLPVSPVVTEERKLRHSLMQTYAKRLRERIGRLSTSEEPFWKIRDSVASSGLPAEYKKLAESVSALTKGSLDQERQKILRIIERCEKKPKILLDDIKACEEVISLSTDSHWSMLFQYSDAKEESASPCEAPDMQMDETAGLAPFYACLENHSKNLATSQQAVLQAQSLSWDKAQQRLAAQIQEATVAKNCWNNHKYKIPEADVNRINQMVAALQQPCKAEPVAAPRSGTQQPTAK